MKQSISRILIIGSAVALACLDRAWGEEGGSGHYSPGAVASFIDMLPGRPGLAVANYFLYYDGSAGATRPFPLGGLVTFDLHARVYCDSVVALYETPLKLFGGNYSAGIAIPYLWLEVDGKVTGPLGNTFSSRDTDNGLGDLTVYPFMLGWTKGDFKCDLRLGVYAPTGNYEVGQLANLGKNYWTFEPALTATWLSSKIGLELSGSAAVGFSTKNDATDYQSGDVVHLDGTIAEHLPLGKLGAIGIGANAFYYQQITGDSSPVSALLGDFEGRTVGVGPVVSFITKLGKNDLVAEVKWLPELDIEKRLKGDYVWVKVGMAF